MPIPRSKSEVRRMQAQGMTIEQPLREIFAQMEQFTYYAEYIAKCPKIADFQLFSEHAISLRRFLQGTGMALGVYNQQTTKGGE